ncbi:MAG: sugar ABC transporter ATP-binding protein [Rhodobacteraceae bacterium]|nr:sugar ABC transporter ATP-binding protein [Paracoccaceae bacterium]
MNGQDENIIEIRGIEKSFPGVKALKGVSFGVKRGTVHCIVGENGAGKSTFIKILTGAQPATRGEIKLGGKPFSPHHVSDAIHQGISCLYQELNIVDELTVEENISLGQEKHKFLFPQKADNLEKAGAILADFDSTVSLGDRVGSLSVAQKQIVEITRALVAECSVLVMDEPTAALSLGETTKIMQVIERLREAGMTIIFISHKLSEIFEIGDTVTVLRDGEMVGTQSLEGMSQPDLVRMMLGKVVAEEYIPSTGARDQAVLEARGVSTRKLKDVNFDLMKGEILGFYGLLGAGKTEVAEVLFGHEYRGEIKRDGRVLRFRTERDALRAGFALVPEERREEGIFGLLSVMRNIPLMNLKTVMRRGLVSGKAERDLADKYIDLLQIATSGRNHPVALLSGGNQQKVVIAKCLNRDADIILMDEPTRGVDIGAKQEIHNIIRDLANKGKSVIVFSSELQEITGLCDRMVLMYDGMVRETLRNGDELSTDYILEVVAGKEA